MSTQVLSPFPLFTSISGAPLNLGYVYIGNENQDPQTFPKQAYWDGALTIPAVQPLRTNGGYIENGGTPSTVFTDGAFSVRVRDKNGVQVFYRASVPSADALVIALRADLASTADDKGAALIGVKQLGTGAINRTAQDELRDRVTSAQFGAEIDGTTDDTVALQNTFLRMQTTFRADLMSGTYKVTGPLSIPPGALEGGEVTLDFSDADAGDFPGGICVLVKGAVKTALPALNSDLAYGDRIIAFASAHNLSVGDTFQLVGTVNGAGNGYQPYYRKGEMFTVGRVVSPTNIETTAACRDSYPVAGITCWKRPGSSFRQGCAKLKIIAPDNITFPLRFETLDQSKIDNTHVEGGGVASINFMDCYGIYGDNLYARQIANVADGYGVNIGYCQGLYLRGTLYGRFNGIATGGGTGPLIAANTVGMNRDIHFEGLAGSDPVDGLSGANFHGNIENSSYRGVFTNGVVMAGNRNEAHGTFIGRSGLPGVQFTEMHGHEFAVSGEVITCGSDLATNVGAVNMGSSGDDYGTHARYGGTTTLDLTIRAPNASRILLWRPTALVRTDVILDLKRFDLMESHASTRVIALNANSGNAIPVVNLRGLNIMDNIVAITWSLDSGTKLRGMIRVKSVGVSLAAAASATQAVTFTPAFPRAPLYSVSLVGPTAPTAPLTAGIQSGSPAASGCTAQVLTTDESSQTGSTTAIVTAVLNEE